MLGLTAWLLAAAVSAPPMMGMDVPRQIDVDCGVGRGLQLALQRAANVDAVDIRLRGVCVGHFVVAAGNVTLRGATPGSGIAAPPGTPGDRPVLEVIHARASLREMIVRDGVVGVLATGDDAEVFLYQVDVHDNEVGVIATDGAHLRMLDSTVRDGGFGIAAENGSNANLQQVHVHDLQVGVTISGRSFGALSDTTVENNTQGGLNVTLRSDVNVLDGVFRENGQVHLNANDWSSITLLFHTVVGSDTDTTPIALSVNRNATIASYSAPEIYGDVNALVNGSIRMGNTTVFGNLTLLQFADAHVRNAEITGGVVCIDGSDAICHQTTTGAVSGCPSATCGSTTRAADRALPAGRIPIIQAPRVDPPPRVRSRPRSAE